MTLPASYYQHRDVVFIARDLLGKTLVTHIEGLTTSGIIVETEAYAGITDKASHAYGGRNTPRTSIMYEDGGVAYVYRCYGIYDLFNVVTNVRGNPQAVLIRAIEPQSGIETMLHRRCMERMHPTLTSGPGKLTRALGITTAHTGLPLDGATIRIEDSGFFYDDNLVETTSRVGVAYAAQDALLPFRFLVKNNPFVSKGKGL